MAVHGLAGVRSSAVKDSPHGNGTRSMLMTPPPRIGIWKTMTATVVSMVAVMNHR